jgi:UDP-glucose 4-epimerase
VSRILVTGGAGFIGSHVVAILVGEGNKVRVLDNLSTGEGENLACAGSRVTLIESDVRDLNSTMRAAKGVDCIIHEAALASVTRSVEDPLHSNEVNITGTLNVLIAAKESGVKRVVFASSSAVYGEGTTLLKSERMTCKPLSPYGVQKLCGELYCKVFSRNFGVETVILRYFNVFGPRQNPDSQYSAVIPIFIRKMLRGERPVILGDGKQMRDFIYVDNVARATVEASRVNGVSGRVFNIGCGRGISLNKLVDAINRILGTHLEPRYDSPRPGDVRDSVADLQLTRKELGYRVTVSFEEGLARTIDYFKKRGI